MLKMVETLVKSNDFSHLRHHKNEPTEDRKLRILSVYFRNYTLFFVEKALETPRNEQKK